MKTLTRDAYCSYCGERHRSRSYPRTCVSCNTQVWANPIPVSIVLVPVMSHGRTGLLVVRRAIEPRKDLLALVGGFLEEHESWAAGGAREIREETNVAVDAAALTPFWFASSEPKPNRVLLFAKAPTIEVTALGPYQRNVETSERGLVFGPAGLDEVFAFALHAEAARRFFASLSVTAEHGYTQV